ncbi:family 16 glycoside hydrolase [Alienimonas californiensis]|uniref:3-keto-alpha-glucoside-1,2-lyase/3-keto-2-hydroxy-glucal hydratase domain-containing protein n=1 Tax=Alienimonas californiensis TaxID=2527989 RepID=A0A517P929_9PLAN|nr:family 16 glycoside hydrolase [Alienimonas californiensis]QDT15877.1 hypothetical protein CA12_19730 [Alienimonas californiensis]
MLVAPLLSCALLGFAPPAVAEPGAVAQPGAVLLEDSFDRAEKDDAKEQVGNGWTTNSKARAKGNKQVDLADGALHITMHAEADHGVSVRHDGPTWTDGTLSLRFKLPPKGDLGVDLADMQEKSVHAGHLLIVRVRPSGVELRDHKAGGMELTRRERRQAGQVTAEDKQVMKDAVTQVKMKIAPNEWHTLSMTTAGDRLSVSIDGKPVGELQSPGIAHPTKRTVRLAVNSEAWVDDFKLTAAE